MLPMSFEQLQTAFALSSRLIESKTFHDLNVALITILNEIDTINDVSSYEILGNRAGAGADVEPLIRKFPLSLDENFTDEYHAVVRYVYKEGTSGVGKHVIGDQAFISIYVNKDEPPEKLVLIQGAVSDYHYEIVKGLASIYEHQINLFDVKERDLLTKLHNRQTFVTTLEQVLNFYRGITPTGKGSYMAILDIDHFKQVNDKFGHMQGDEVLIHFANLMSKAFRHADFLFRYGGEEFVVIINQTDETAALALLDSFRLSVKQFSFPSGHITVSIGVTEVNSYTPIPTMIEIADEALYLAKHNGRDRIEVLNRSTKSVVDNDIEFF